MPAQAENCAYSIATPIHTNALGLYSDIHTCSYIIERLSAAGCPAGSVLENAKRGHTGAATAPSRFLSGCIVHSTTGRAL